MSGAPVGQDKSGSRASAPKGARYFSMPHGWILVAGGSRLGAGGLGAGNWGWYAGCHQTRAVEEGKDEGGVGTEGGHNKHAGCMGGEKRALGVTRRME